MSKILHISNTDISVDSRILKELAVAVEIPNTSTMAIGVSDTNQASRSTLNDFDYIELQMVSRNLSFLPRAIRYFFELIEFTIKAVLFARALELDVVHCHDTFALPSGWILKKITGAKLIYDAHELESNKNGQNVILSKATLFIERVCWSKIDVLISVSLSIIEWYKTNLGDKRSILVLNSPVYQVDESLNSPNGVSAKGRYFHKKYNIPEDHLVFVYLGILGVGRGIEVCLNAFSNGPEKAHAVFMGFGQLESLILDASKQCANIHFHPSVPHHEVVPIVRNADYGLCFVENVSLSDYYCLPNKLFEYCFAGIPVLASDFPEISRIVKEYSLGKCCAPEPSSISAMLLELIEFRPTRPSTDCSALSWTAQAERISKLYRDLVLIPE